MEVFRRKASKYYWYDFTVPGYPRQRGSTKETNEQRAKKIAAFRLNDLLEGKSPFRRKQITLRQQWEKFKMSELFLSKDPDTQRYYENGWRLLEKSQLPNMRMSHISSEDVDSLRVDGSPSNVNNARRTLRRLLNLGVRWGTIAKRPTVSLLKENERNLLLDQLAEDALLPHSPQPLKDIIVLLRDLGMRNACELYATRVEHINWNNRTVFVPDSKTPTGVREVPMGDRVMDILMMRCAGRREGWVFPSRRKGKHITAGLVSKQWVKARKAAGLPASLVLYCARHDYGTSIVRSTGNLKLAMTAMGQTDIKTALRYQHHAVEQVRDVMNLRQQQRNSNWQPAVN